MKALQFMNASLFIEISQKRLWALSGNRGMETELERGDNGRLTPASRQKARASLADFIQQINRLSRPKALCAIGARGVSLRRATLPIATGDELRQLVRLRIETEFPLSPDDLAWGFQPLDPVQNDGPARQDVLIAAVRKETVREYEELIHDAGADAVFTVAALARVGLCPATPLPFALLNVETAESELTLFDQGIPTALRALPGGSAGVKAVADAIDPKQIPGKLLVAGSMANAFQQAAPAGPAREIVKYEPGLGHSAATLAMKHIPDGRGALPILLGMDAVRAPEIKVRRAPWKWAGIAAGLLLCLLLASHIEALIGKPLLERQLAKIEAQRGVLAVIDRELGFLQNLKRSQPPYVEALYVIANAAPPGAKLESINMSRSGDVSLRGSMQNGQIVNDFRAKLIASGFFTNVVIDEQVPTPDRQKVNIRITTQWKPVDAREQLAIGPFLGADGKTNAPGGTNLSSSAPTNSAPSTNNASGSNIASAKPANPPPPPDSRGAPPPPPSPGSNNTNPVVKEGK
jgi:hypothetical protein